MVHTVKKTNAKGGKGVHKNHAVAKEIYRQLGKGTLFMLGANTFVADEKSLSFQIKGSRKVHYIHIIYDYGSDTYKVEFWKRKRGKVGVDKVSEYSNIYVGDLHELIRNNTGLETRMPTFVNM